MALQQDVAPTRQDVPGESQGPGGPPTGAAPGPPPAGASDQFAAQTLSSLLSAQETQGGSSDLAARLIGSADADGDGLLSLTELQSTAGGESTDPLGLTPALGAIDTNGDGKLSQDELSAVLDAGKAKGAHHAHHGHHASGADMASKLIGDADTDGDGS